MTACSAHPGTPQGAALAELFAAVEAMTEQLRTHEQELAARCGLSRLEATLLRHMLNAAGPVESDNLGAVGLEDQQSVADAVRRMLDADLIVSTNTAEVSAGSELTLSRHGMGIIAELERLRAGWLDETARQLDVAGLQTSGVLLRRLAAGDYGIT